MTIADYHGTALILMLLDTLRGIALSSIKNPAIQQPFLLP
jgi:hypothetical protein